MSQVAPAQHYCRRGKVDEDVRTHDRGNDVDQQVEVRVPHPRAGMWRPLSSERSQGALLLKGVRYRRLVSRPGRSESPRD